jgi:hypothetical protein
MTDTLLKAYHGLPAPLRSVAACLRGLSATSAMVLRLNGSLKKPWIERAGHLVIGQWKAWHEERLAYVLHRAATRVP